MAPSPEDFAGMFATITEQLSSMLLRLDQNDTTVHQLSSQVAQLSSEQPAALAHNPTRTAFTNRADHTRALKLQLNQFEGTDPVSWVFQAEQYFQFLQIPGDQRLHLAAFYMKGEALVWYRWMHTNRQLLSWDEFVRNLTLRFGPSDFENPQQSLFKLQQTTTVADYQTRFEKLCNQVVGLSPEMLLNCFISGLRDDIKNDLKPLRPYSVSDAIGLAKMLEEKVASARQLPSRFSRPATGHNTFTPGVRPQSQPQTGATSTVKATPPLLPPPSLPIKRLTGVQMQERRALGLCYNCDEKFVVGHRCQPRLFLLMCADPEDDASLPEDIPADPTPPTFLHLSAHAFQGLPNPKTLTFQGAVLGHAVSVLVDTGSTHNVMPPRLARFLRLPIKPVPRFHVMVGNGNHIDCSSYCPDIALNLEGTLFHVSFYLLDIQGADLVLGMEWLRTLGQVTSDFSIPSMSFMVGDTQRTLIGRPLQAPLQASFQQLRRFWQHDAIAECHTIACFPHTTAIFFQLADLTTCPADFNADIWQLLQQYSPVFATPQGLPPVRPQDHHITLLPGSAPVNVRPYRYPHSQKEAMSTLLSDMVQDGIVVPSTSPFSSPVLLIKKKDGSWRFCVDYRSLNAMTVKDRFPMPTIDELIDELGGSTIYSKIDLRSGFHQIRVVPEDTHKTAFRTVDGHYEFLVMPFGLTNAPSTFQAAMNDLLRPHLRKFVLVFFDDILIYSPDLLSHLEHLRIVLDSLLSNHFYAKLSKCAFGVATIDYLGHVITPTGIKPDASKVQAIQDWPTPRSLTALRGFLGLTGFYRRFVQHYATHAAPLTDLLQTDKFKWTDTAEQAFSKMKSILSSAPVLALPNFSIPFDVETDASGVAIGAVLAQQKHPIAYFSKKMCMQMRNQSTYVREMYAITEAIKKWRQYLLGSKFHIYTDQQSLRHLLTQAIQTPEQQKWASKLIGFDFEIHYKPGSTNIVADALSRCHSDTPLLAALTSAVPTLLDQLRQFYSSAAGKEIWAQSIVERNFTHHNKLLYYKGSLFVPDIPDLRKSLMTEYHSSPTAGHSGIHPSLSRLAASFNWPGMYTDIKEFIKHCPTCQFNKHRTTKKQGLLQPIPTPSQVWEDISMDFITGLPPSQGHSVIWVVVDRLSKYSHFIGLPAKFTAESLAARFSTEILRLHGLPRSIISDRDKLFLSHFWRELFRVQGTKLHFSTAYHPETDGQTEVVNKGLETYLRCFSSEQPKSWFRFLHLAELWYNTSFHSSAGMSPFRALYGRDPPCFLDYVTGSASEASLDSSLQNRTQIMRSLKANLQKAQQRMKSSKDRGRMDVTFAVDEWVLLKLQPYRQQTLVRLSSQKLAWRFFGPFKIIRRVGAVAYELDLPPESRLHPVFHVSLLRRFHGDPALEFVPLPVLAHDLIYPTPAAVLPSPPPSSPAAPSPHAPPSVPTSAGATPSDGNTSPAPAALPPSPAASAISPTMVLSTHATADEEHAHTPGLVFGSFPQHHTAMVTPKKAPNVDFSAIKQHTGSSTPLSSPPLSTHAFSVPANAPPVLYPDSSGTPGSSCTAPCPTRSTDPQAALSGLADKPVLKGKGIGTEPTSTRPKRTIIKPIRFRD